MKTSELIEKLQASLAEHGDLEVVNTWDRYYMTKVEEVGSEILYTDGSRDFWELKHWHGDGNADERPVKAVTIT